MAPVDPVPLSPFVQGRRSDGNPNVSHAWARTVEGAQGGTWEAVHLPGGASLDALMGYTGQSRGREPTHTSNTRPLVLADTLDEDGGDTVDEDAAGISCSSRMSLAEARARRSPLRRRQGDEARAARGRGARMPARVIGAPWEGPGRHKHLGPSAGPAAGASRGVSLSEMATQADDPVPSSSPRSQATGAAGSGTGQLAGDELRLVFGSRHSSTEGHPSRVTGALTAERASSCCSVVGRSSSRRRSSLSVPLPRPAWRHGDHGPSSSSVSPDGLVMLNQRVAQQVVPVEVGGVPADERSAAEVVAGLIREPVSTFAAADDPWVLDARLGAEREEHWACSASAVDLALYREDDDDVEVAGIEPASFGFSTGLLRAQPVEDLGPPVVTGTRRGAPVSFGVPGGPLTKLPGEPRWMAPASVPQGWDRAGVAVV